MRCPKCGAELVVPNKHRFETLSEHVSCPNATPPLREVYVCRGCDISGYYNEWGEYYGSYPYVPIPRKYWQALDSMEYDIKWEVEPELRPILESLPDEVIENDR